MFSLILFHLRLHRATIFLSIFCPSHIPARLILTLHIQLMTCQRLFLPIWTKVLLSEAWISIRWNKLFFLVSSYWDIVTVSFYWTPEWKKYLMSLCFCMSVGTNIGDIAVWEVGCRDRLAFKNFKVWDLGACSVTLQVSYCTNNYAKVWSPFLLLRVIIKLFLSHCTGIFSKWIYCLGQPGNVESWWNVIW